MPMREGSMAHSLARAADQADGALAVLQRMFVNLVGRAFLPPEPIAKHKGGDAMLAEPARFIISFMQDPKFAVPAARSKDDGRPRRCLLRRQKDSQVRVVHASDLVFAALLDGAGFLFAFSGLESRRALLPQRHNLRLVGASEIGHCPNQDCECSVAV